MAGTANPATLWVDKRLDVEGDVLLATRLVEIFGGEVPLEVG